MTSRANRASKPLMIASTGFVLIWVFIAAFPFVWTLWGSFKVQGDFFLKSRLALCAQWDAHSD